MPFRIVRIAWVTPQAPRPHGGAGEVLEFELLRIAARTHRVHVISSGLAPAKRSPDLDELDVSYEGVSWSPAAVPRGRVARFIELLTKDAGTTLWHQGDRVQALRDALDRYQAGTKVDLVQIVMSEAAPAATTAHVDTRLILFDALQAHVRREASEARRIRDRVFWRIQLAKVKDWERDWYSCVDRLACNSRADAELLGQVLNRRVEVVPNVIASTYFEEPTTARQPKTVAFIGSLAYRPNVDAVVWLTEEVWPRIAAQEPAAKLCVVGRSPTDEVRRAVAAVRGELHVDVPDIRPYYWAASVTVAPLRLGSGLRNKVVHAMACGSPVVATPAAIEGLAVRHGEHLLVARGASSFAEAVIGVLRSPSLASVRARRGRKFSQRFHADVAAKELRGWWG